MSYGIMNSTWKVLWLSLIFHRITETQGSSDTFTTVVQGIQKFYLTPSTYIVFDRDEINFKRERFLLELIKLHSRRDYMSQAITYKDLRRLSNRDNTLYTLIIHDRENLEHAINATKTIDMSMHPWFLYIRKAANFNCDKPDEGDFFKLKMDTWMAVMCEGNTILKSYHAIFDNQTEIADLAVWSRKKMQLEFKSDMRLIKSRMDLKGITLRLAVTENRSILTNNVNDNIAKFKYELLDEVATLSNFKAKVVAVNTELGYLDSKTKEWYGLMKLMDEKLADIGVALFALSRKRMKAVDYVIPLAKGRRFLYAKLPDDTQVLWTTYFKVFSEKSWAVTGASIMIFSILVYLIKNGRRRVIIQSFFEDFLKIWGVFSMQGSSDASSRISIKIIYFSMLFISLILNAIYSASITSYIAVLSPQLPFSSLSEFLRDNSYDLIVVKGSRDHSYILSNNSKLAQLQSRLKMSSFLPGYASEGFQQACVERTAFYTDEVMYDSMQNFLPCKLGAVSMQQVKHMSFVLTKNSPYNKAINYHILRLMNRGILKRLRQKYFRKYVEIVDVQRSVITCTEVWPIMVIWAIGLVITVTGLILEIIVFRFSLRCSSKRKSRSRVNKKGWSMENEKLRKNMMYNTRRHLPYCE